jgi:hypothetical protein
MRRVFVAIIAALLFTGSVMTVSAALWKFDGTQRFVASHDGNCYDKDDLGASAFVWAICWSFGAVDKICHFEHSNNLAGCSGTNSQYLEMKASAEGGAIHFGLGADTGYGQVGIVYDFIADPDKCVAHFKVESDKNTATNTMVEVCAGPMESTYRNLMATDQAKRQYITLVSHSSWNETFTGANGMSHTWSACKGIPGGAIFVDISDQSSTLGTTMQWDALKTIGTKNGKTQADWDWLFSRQSFKPGDVSDSRMVFYIFTGSQKVNADSLIRHFNNPLGSTNVVQPPPFPAANLNDRTVTLARIGSNLTVSLIGSQENGSVKICDLMNRLVCAAPLSGGSAVIPAASMSRGTYIINIHAGNRKMVKEYINR